MKLLFLTVGTIFLAGSGALRPGLLALRNAAPRPVLAQKVPTSPPLKPGVYQSLPYSGIVIVPGPQADDRAVVAPKETLSAMPMIKPDVRFIPWSPKK